VDLLGILVFVLFVFLSIAGKAAQEKERRRRELQGRPAAPRAPQWPGPVAGPGFPGYPQPTFPQRPPRPQKLEPVPSQADDEGTSPEGVGMEGPQPGETTEAEVARFEQQTQDVDREAENVRREATRFATSDSGSRQLGDLAQSAAPEYEVKVQMNGNKELQGALLTQGGLAQAVVMAEILGRPKALQGRRVNARGR